MSSLYSTPFEYNTYHAADDLRPIVQRYGGLPLGIVIRSNPDRYQNVPIETLTEVFLFYST